MLIVKKNINYHKYSDDQIIISYKKSKNIEFLGELFQRYMHLVYGVCLKYYKDREESKDAVILIFEKLVIEIEKHKVENFKSWLYVLTKNYCLMELRHQKTINKKFREYSADQIMESTINLHPIDETDNLDLKPALKECIEKLRKEQKKCIQLFYFNNKCYKEISEMLKIPENKVKSFIQNGKRNLKICLESKNG